MAYSDLDQACLSGRLVGDGPTNPKPAQHWGINLSPGDVPIWANLIRHGNYFSPATNPHAYADGPLDANGCPTTDFSFKVYPHEKLYTIDDTFPIRFVGRADVACVFHGTVTDLAYDAAANVTTATLRMDFQPEMLGEGAWLVFTNTRRLPADTTATGIDARTLSIMRPLAPGSAQHHDPSEKFNRQLKVALAPWRGANGYWRDLDAANINGVPDLPALTPANRTRPDAPIQMLFDDVRGHGISIEDRIELANFLGIGWWTNFPDTGTPELFQLTLDIVKFGSDAAGTPYTGSAGANPWPGGSVTNAVHAPLAGKFMWEESNEVWNFGFNGQLGRYLRRSVANQAALDANHEVNGLDANGVPYTGKGGSNPSPDGSPYPLALNYCQVAADLLGHADQARAAFPGGLGVKYFPMLPWQAGNNPTYDNGLRWLRARLATRNETIGQNIAAGGGASYEGMVLDPATPGVTADSFFAAGQAAYVGIASDAQVIPSYDGLGYCSYEGGLYTSDNFTAPAVVAVNRDPRIRPFVRDRALNMAANGCRFVTIYALMRGQWSILDSIHDLTDPRYLGHRDAIARFPADGSPGAVVAPVAPFLADPGFDLARLPGLSTVTYGPPGTGWTFDGQAGISQQVNGLIGADQPVPSGFQAGMLQSTASIGQSVPGWGGGSYRITGRMAAWRGGPPTVSFDVLVGGKVVGTFAAPNAGAFARFATDPFTPGAGTHPVLLRTTSGVGSQVAILDDLAIAPATIPVNPAKANNGGATGLISAIGAAGF